MARLSFEEDLVYVVSATAVRVTERTHNKKRYTFQIDLEWSDGNVSSSFRSYSEFFDLQCELLDAFPEEAGRTKGVERSLPFLPGKKLFRTSSRSLAEERLPLVQSYVQELVAMPKHISKSDQVIRFFRSNWSEDRLKCRKWSTSQRPGSSNRGESGESAVAYSVRKDTLEFDAVQTTKSPPPPSTSDEGTTSDMQVGTSDSVTDPQHTSGAEGHAEQTVGASAVATPTE